MKLKEIGDKLLEKYSKFKDYVKDSKKVLVVLLAISLLLNIASMTVSGAKLDDIEALNAEIVKLKEENQEEVDKLNNKINKLTTENKELEAKVKEASPWFEMKEEERKAEEERLAKEKAEKEEAERKAKEEEERKAKEEAEKKEKQGYDTGITYNNLARTPDEYEGEKCKFSGKVIQVMEGDGLYNIRLAVGGNYNNIIFILAKTSISSERILEDDYITVYGVSTGIYTYETVMGNELSIPSMVVDKIDM